jgi:hypothetical protein
MPDDSEGGADSPEDLGQPGLPPLSPPQTKTPFQVYQQFNVQQIPPRAGSAFHRIR